MSEIIRKSHNKSILLYHFVCPAKYRKVIFDTEVDITLKNVCLEISKRYEIIFLEIGTDKDHVHFLVQSVPTYSPRKIVQIVKSITAREVFKNLPSVKKELWGGEFWTDGYFISSVGQHGTEAIIKEYIREQGSETDYQRLHHQPLQLDLF